MAWLAIWGLTATVCAIAGYFMAGAKNRDSSAWAAWCFVFPPALVFLLLARKNTGPRPRQPRLDDLDREHF